ncbi:MULTISPECIES: HAD family hydrolase [Streptomyces]|uniref:Haloacid dehalogenase superfamily, subfamily IA, variant 3 with third motif having DD or ED n=1 Tax=Streptomyces radiopugnans TaxID=403935 RepID=A0A1H9DNR8_9ACTN|nr:HAD family hydrolase [Streptomyces radiopugnans]SEQ15124.1 haloacid dehalogenase superfamily, subfamily IA, variant 3 with third motif having DD or ED [Streptomyces radiopugnans]
MSGDGTGRAVLFDVDGTLVDTTYLHTVAWWEALRQSGRRVPMSVIHRTIGMGSDQLLARFLGEDHDPDEAAAVSAAHHTLYAEYWPRLAPLDGAAELLRACADRGWTVVLASSARGDELEAMRRAVGADEAVTAATSSDDVEASKPAPDLVRSALDGAQVTPDRAVFVGDTVWDVAACERAGVPCVGVLSGGITRRELEEAGAAEVYENPADLLAHLDGSLLARRPGRG